MPSFLSLETPTSTLESILRILTHARGMITPQTAWAKDALAYNDKDEETDYLSENAVCWCLTGGVWKGLHQELDLPADCTLKSFAHVQENTGTTLGKEQIAVTMLTFRHLASYVPEPDVFIRPDADLTTCHDELTNYNDAYGTAQLEILLLLDKAAADIQALLHKQKNLPLHDFKPLAILTLKGIYGQPDSPMASLPEQPSTQIGDLFQAFVRQTGKTTTLLSGDQLMVQLYPNLD